MTCNPCLRVHDFKEVIKDILHCVSDNPEAAYGLLQFFEVNLAGGEWRNLLIRMSTESAAHAKLHGVLLHQPDTFTSTDSCDNEDNNIIPWFEPTYTTPLPIGQLNLPVNERTTANIATLIKSRWQPNTNNPKQLRCLTVPLSVENITADDLTI
jgi:hypothetical protein